MTLGLNKREQFMLWKMLEFQIHRYLLVTLRREGYEKAMLHIEISETIWEVKHLKTKAAKNHEAVMRIHDVIAEKLTNHMDRTIGLDMDKDNHEQDFDLLKDKFFRRLLKIDLP